MKNCIPYQKYLISFLMLHFIVLKLQYYFSAVQTHHKLDTQLIQTSTSIYKKFILFSHF